MSKKITVNNYLLIRWSDGDRYRVAEVIRADRIEPARREAKKLIDTGKPGETIIIAQELEEIL